MSRNRWAWLIGLSAVLLVAGCGASNRSSPSPSAPPASGVVAPKCLTQATPFEAPVPTDAGSTTLSLPGAPWGVGVDGSTTLVALSATDGSQLAVITSGLTLSRLVTLPGAVGAPAESQAAGLSVSRDGRYAAVADERVTEILDLPAVLAGQPNPVLGALSSADYSSVEVAFSADDDYVFVSDEISDRVAVFDLSRALQSGFAAAGVLVGYVPVGQYPVGMTLSPDGQHLYVVNEPPSNGLGQLSVIDVSRAETDPATAVVAHAAAGCDPVRVVISANGGTAWVAARGSNAVLDFNTADLIGGHAGVLHAVMPVGVAPTGLLLLDNDHTLLVADSNRDVSPPQPGQITVLTIGVSTPTATITAGEFPRELAYDASNNTVLVSNFTSHTVQSFPAPG
jgi:DNA-binding beta-propeller fold protein YncE